ncbi:hypothetical protein GCM10029963_10070 [Micromonospora andamanensis]
MIASDPPVTTVDRATGPHPPPPAQVAGPVRLPVAVAMAVAAGLALLLAFPPYGWWPLAPVGVALLAAATHRRRLRAGAGLGFLTGVTLFAPMLAWTNLHTGYLPWVLLSLLQAGYLAVLGMATAWVSPLADRFPAVWPALTGVLWVGQEALRDRTPFGGFPWGRLAFGQDGSPLLRLASVGGAPLVTFSVALAGGLLVAGAWWTVRARATGGPRWWAPAAGCAATVLLLLAGGLLVPVATTRDTASVTVAIVQGNVPRLGLDFNAQRQAVLDNHVDATIALAGEVAAGSRPRPDLVVWPENSSDIDPLRNASAGARISAARTPWVCRSWSVRCCSGRSGGRCATRGCCGVRAAAPTWISCTSNVTRCRSPSTCRCGGSPGWSATRSTGSGPTSWPAPSRGWSTVGRWCWGT